MKDILGAVVLVLVLLLGYGASYGADSYSRTIDLYRASPQARPFFSTAYGMAVFPVMGKGGLLLGAAFGEGRVYRAGRVTGTASQFNFSLGLQAGGQAFSEIIFFQDKRAYDEFTRGSFELEAKTSAVLITVGVQAQTGSGGNNASASAVPSLSKQFAAQYVKGMAVFVHIHGGLMLEATVGGQVFEFEPLQR